LREAEREEEEKKSERRECKLRERGEVP